MRLPIAFLLLAAATLPAQVPQLINYQGRVAVGAVNFNGPGLFKFALVNATGTTTYWSNDGTSSAGSQPATAVSLAVSNGLYSVLLGDATLPNMTIVPATVFTNPDVRLRVWFNDGTVNGSQLLTPDQRIAAVGYAMMAGNVPDASITPAKLATSAVTATKLATGAVTATKLAASAVTAASIAPGTITGTQLASNLTLLGTTTGVSANFSGTLSVSTAFRIDPHPVNVGADNLFAGNSVGQANTIGYKNTFMGSYAGASNIEGPNNVFIGYEAGNRNIGGNSGTFVGIEAGYSNTSGDSNTFLGPGAGRNNTTGSHNIGLGPGGGYNLTTGNRNIAIGHEGVAGNNGIIRIGTPGFQSDTYLTGVIHGDGSGLKNLPANPPGMVLISAGPFTMGDSLDGSPFAVPISTTVSAFYMDVNLVTLSQWRSVYFWAKDNGYTDLPAGSGKGANHPVQTVNWYAVVKWCNARSEQAGRTPAYYTNDAQTTIYKTGNVNVTNAQVKWTANGYRLPTEAEWEKAARGGLSGQRFPWGNTIEQNLANYFGNTGGFVYDLGPNGYNPIGSVGGTSPATSPVGSFAANGYGLYDMAGNVDQWVWDWYGEPYAGGLDPLGRTTGSFRVVRGGAWGFDASYLRCAYRSLVVPSNALIDVGFRGVLPPGQP
jgi:formylglycine-generating enzyme required for sulfatase activity